MIPEAHEGCHAGNSAKQPPDRIIIQPSPKSGRLFILRNAIKGASWHRLFEY